MSKNNVTQQESQVLNLILSDHHSRCEIISPLNYGSNGEQWFLTHNKATGAKYRIEVKIIEV